MIIGPLEVQMAANLATLKTDMAQAKQIVSGAASDISSLVGTINSALSLLGVGISVASLVALTERTFESIVRMKELATMAGTTVEGLSRFEEVALKSGSSLEAMSTMMYRMSRALSQAENPSSRAAAALNSIGLSVNDLKGLKPDETFLKIADALNKYSDGVGKNAVEQVIFSRAGREMNLILEQLRENHELAATVTTAQAAAAKDLEDKLTHLNLQFTQAKRQLVSEYIPSVVAVVDAFTKAKEQGGLLSGVISGLAQAFVQMKLDPDVTHVIVIFFETISVLAMTASVAITAFVRTLAGAVVAFVQWQKGDVLGLQATSLAMWEDLDQSGKKWMDYYGKIKKVGDDFEEKMKSMQKAAADMLAQAPGNESAGLAMGRPDYGKPVKFSPGAGAEATAYQRLNEEIQRKLVSQREELSGDDKQYIATVALVTKLNEQVDKLHGVSDATKARMKADIAQIPVNQQLIQDLKTLGIGWTQMAEQAAKADTALNVYVADNQKQLKSMKDEYSMMLLTDTERKIANALLAEEERYKRLLATLLENSDEYTPERFRQAKQFHEEQVVGIANTIKQTDALKEQMTLWGSLSDKVGSFFQDMVAHGGNAFDKLKTMVRDMIGEFVGLFAKKFMLQFAASFTSGGTSAMFTGMAGQVGQNTMWQGFLNTGGSSYSSFSPMTSSGGTWASSGPTDYGQFTPIVTGGGQFSSGTGNVAMGTLGAAGMGYGAGALAGSLWGNNRNQGTMSAGGAVGAGIGYYVGMGASVGGPWGAVIGAIIGIIAGSLISSGGGPKTGGSSMVKYGPHGENLGTVPVPGTDNGRFFTPSQEDPLMASLNTAIAKGFFTTLKQLGGTTEGMSFGMGRDADPNGTASSRLSSMVVDAAGKILYKAVDKDVSNEDMQAAMELESKRMMLVALQGSQLPPTLAAILATVNAASATAEQIDAILGLATAFAALTDALKPIKYQDVIDAANLTQYGAFVKAGAALTDLSHKTNMTAEDIATLTASTVDFRAAAVQLIVALEQVNQQIVAMFGTTAQNIMLSGMTPQQQYDWYQQDAATSFTQAMASKDPAEISRLATRINNDWNGAWSLLPPDQQALMRGLFLGRIDTTTTALTSHIHDVGTGVTDTTNTILTGVKDTMDAAALALTTAGVDLSGAAKDLNATHVTVDVNVHDDRTLESHVVNDGG